MSIIYNNENESCLEALAPSTFRYCNSSPRVSGYWALAGSIRLSTLQLLSTKIPAHKYLDLLSADINGVCFALLRASKFAIK